jgi:putative ABC transport system substrate-binding protein
MRRREFLALGGGAVAAWPIATHAQHSKRAPVLIGWLAVVSRESGAHFLAAFKDGLSALGWKEGPHVVIEDRWADGQIDRLQPLGEELAELKPAVIVAFPALAVAAAAKAAPQTAIVHATGVDPITAGFAASLARPGGMVTGITNEAADISEKHLELLLAVAPKLRKIGFLNDSTTPNRIALMHAAQRSIVRFSVEGRFAEVASPKEIVPAISGLANEGSQALVVLASPILLSERRRIIELTEGRRWPLAAWSREWPVDGALLSYGSDFSANMRRAAYYVDRILKGAKPGDLPIEQPTRFYLVINKRTADALGLAISTELFAHADEVIE